MKDWWEEITQADYRQLAERFGTPFFLYSVDKLVERVARVRAALNDEVSVYFAVKANPNLELLRRIRGAVDGLDVSSVGELEQSKRAGYDLRNVSFAGPAKTSRELTAAVAANLGFISVESLRELEECVEIATAANGCANIGLRINPKSVSRTYGMKMGGKATQFGIDEENLAEALEFVLRNEGRLRLRGVHVYVGSQCFQPAGVLEHVSHTLELVKKLETDTGLNCEVINLGGGFGVSHTEESKELEMDELASELLPRLREFRAESSGEKEFVFELGRYLVADAGIYVSRVVSEKQSRGKSFYLLDGGLHHHLAAAGTFGSAFRSNYLVRNLTNPAAEPEKCSVAGPSCNPTDLLGIDVNLSRPRQDDLVAVLKSGAYGFTASPVLFLGRPTAAELIHDGGDVVLGRRSWDMSDFN